MADLYASRQAVRLNDGTADANNAAVLAAAPASGDYGLTTRQVGVAAAAALADGTSNPTTIGAAGFNEIFGGTNWDRMRSVVAGQDSTGTGILASGLTGQFDDASTTTVTENNWAPVRISSRRALLVEGVASGTNLNVNLAASAATVTVDSELPAAAALADATANPTVPGVGGFLMGYNGATWDRVRTANTGRLQVDVITGAFVAATLVDNAAFTDGTTPVSPVGYIFDEVAGTALTENDVAAARIDSKRAQVGVIEDATTRGQRAAVSAAGALAGNITQVGGTALALGQTTMSASIPVAIASNQSSLTVDTELPAAAALADAVANPTVPAVGAYLVGYNGATWDRVRTANTGRLQVDVITGGSSAPANELPSGYNALSVYGSTSGTAAAGTASVVTNTPANTKLFYVRQALVSASGQTKAQVKFGATVLATFFTDPSKLTEVVRFDPPIPGTGDGSTALTIDVTNREAAAMDLYARLGGIVQA